MAKRRRFRDLHARGFFVLPNPWDAGSARLLEDIGFAALATTSSGAADAAGLKDGQLSLEAALHHFQLLQAATSLPLNADFENGFADDPDAVADNVARAIATGVAGLSIEDRPRLQDHLYDDALSVRRIRAARAAIDASGTGTILVARTEAFLLGHTEIEPILHRLCAMSDAGADCLYAPGVRDPQLIRRIVEAVAPKPVNVLLMTGMRAEDMAGLGVRRASTGGALAKAAKEALRRAAQPLFDAQRK